ncbi:ATP-dependent helicase [Cellulomonas cellasea]|uniref:ATP-dependent Lhr-like helicase n=1 Tax=Cellulomonas cellasea TaxID=43670 RepID=A0A7W4YDZ2_9CELL|nr:ATP-dependent helicase [Cellulomonas cellasea]MBB2925076.1 ATP-dependent Lhr-like helicase [Cellulomonas cellasea]
MDEATQAEEVLGRFSAPTRDWFTGAFAGPTTAQVGAWQAVSSGEHALVVAPTGSGKTLAAFLWALDGLLGGGSAAGESVPPAEPEDPTQRCRVLYVSPLKALATDVERNLRSPLVGIRQAATRAGRPIADVSVGVRTGDTPPAERRAFATKPPDILITTPESLFLVLTSAARAGLSGVRTVILDEIHAVAGTKRGAHLAVSLERLDALLDRPGGPGPAQRIGLSATVRPVDAVAAFLGGARAHADGGRRVVVVQPPSTKRIEVDVVVPVPDLADLASAPAVGTPGPDALPPGEVDLTGPAAGAPPRPSIWPHVEERVVDLVAEHRSTLVFTNSRRGAERLTARMNEVWAERQGEDVPDPGELQPAAAPAQSGTAVGVDTRDAATILARAHHGSMSRAERTRTETELKAGRLPAVVATSSLELGIDMGAVDLVVQVGAPPSVASGLQRVGRAGHQVGAVSHGIMFPTFRGELVPAAVTATRMRRGELEALHVPANPLDVLAQQVVAMVATEDWSVADLAAVVRRAAPYSGLGDATLHAVLDMLAGRYPSEEFAELRPRIIWDRARDVLSGRPGALRLAVTSGGTIPDRGLYGVFLASGATTSDVPVDAERTGGQLRGGKRVGELDEEMVYESRVGDTFTLGSSTWRIDDITPDRVLVTPAPGVPGRLPFWKGDAPGRPAELGQAMGAWVREVAAKPDEQAREQVAAAGLDPWATDNLLSYLREQEAAAGQLPTDTTLVVERFRDELGDWRVVLHSPYGARVHAPWALVIAARLRERFGVDAAAMHSDDGIVLRLPDMLSSDAAFPLGDGLGARWADDAEAPPVGVDDLLVDADEVADAVRGELGGSAMFGARFREAAARALLLPRRRPDKRQPLWQQRQRSAQLLSVAAQYPEFPILLEAVRECLQDDFDVAALTTLMRDIASRTIRVVEVTTTTPSPFAQSLLFGYTAQFLYDGDAPLAERRAAALTLDPTLLAELLGAGQSQLADLLDPVAVQRTEAELAGTAPDRQARTLEALADVVRRHGPLTTADAQARTVEAERAHVPAWLAELETARRVLRVRLGGVEAERGEQWAAIEDAGRLRDALGVALPVGVPEVFTEVRPDPLGDLVRRHARTHGPFPAAQVAARFGLGVAVVTEVLRRLEQTGVLVQGRLRPDELGGTGDEYCDAEVLRTLRRRSLAALRAEVEPVDQQALGVFLPRWQGIDPSARRTGGLRGIDGLARAVEQLAGAAVPASALETHILPVRVVDYSPAMLDELTAAGEVLWAGHGALAGHDGLVSLHPASVADLTLPLAVPVEAGGFLDTPLHRATLAALAGGGAYFVGGLLTRVREILATQDPSGPGPSADASGAPGPAPAAAAPGTAGEPAQDGAATASQSSLTAALWDLVWAGHVTNDGLAVLRARLGTGATAHRTKAPAARSRNLGGAARFGLRSASLAPRGTARPGAALLAEAGGRWSLLPERESDPTLRAHALAAQLLDRHGVLTRAVAPAEGVTAQFGAVYRVLAALEQAGQVRRGYFVEHLGGSQFALPGAVDRLREDARTVERAREQAAESADDAVGSPGSADPWSPAPHQPERTRFVVALAATDPANPYGAALAWPPPSAADGLAPGATGLHRPGRKAGAVVVLVDGALVLYVERGGRTVLTFTQDPALLDTAAGRLADAVRTGNLGRMTLHRADGAALLEAEALRSPLGRALAAAGFAPTPRGLRLRGQA